MVVFEEGVHRTEEITSCCLMYEQFVREKLSELPGIGAWETNFIFGEIKKGFLSLAPRKSMDMSTRAKVGESKATILARQRSSSRARSLLLTKDF
jgi:hypothetical protein